MSEQNGSWSQSNLGAAIVGGLIVGFVLLVLTPIWNAFTSAPLPLPWWAILLVGLVAAALIASLLSKRWRRAIWVPLGQWFRGLLPVTTRTHRRAVAAAFQAGIESEKESVAAERAVARNPTWHVDAQDRLGEHDLLWLENHGWEVTDVAMTCDPALFMLDGQVSWPGTFGSNQPGGYVGKQFRGQPTELGKTQGVVFHVVWRDMNGDEHEAEVPYPPKEMRAGEQAIRDEAWAEGRAAGKAEVRAEIEQARPAPPPIKPRWLIVRDTDPEADASSWIVGNVAEGAIALHVSVDAGRDGLVFLSAADWPDMTGGSRNEFSAHLTQSGERYGVNFSISWTDANGARQSERIYWDPDA